MILTSLLKLFVLALIWCGCPAALAVFGLMVLGRKICGAIGIKIAAAVAILLASAPLLRFMEFYVILSFKSGHAVAPDGEGMELVPVGIAMIAGVVAMLFYAWTDQMIKAEEHI